MNETSSTPKGERAGREMEEAREGGKGETNVAVTSQQQTMKTTEEPNRVSNQLEGTKKMRVPDGGWGWMVAFGAFLGCVSSRQSF